MTIRAPVGNRRYWDKWVDYTVKHIGDMWAHVSRPAGDPTYRPQFVFELTKEYWHLMLLRYSRGDPIGELAQHFGPMLDAWEESERLGRDVYTAERQYTRRTWEVNYDHYIVCFWLVGLALTLDIPEEQWRRLLALIDNEGEDILLDRIIATRTPGRRIGKELCFSKPYARLLAAIDAPAAQQPRLLREFVAHWYEEMAVIYKSGRAEQAVPFPHPYWYKLGDQNFEGGGYFGRWCVEAVAAVKAFGMDDSMCIDLPHYPGDLLRADDPSTHHAPVQPVEHHQVRGVSNGSLVNIIKRFFGQH